MCDTKIDNDFTRLSYNAKMMQRSILVTKLNRQIRKIFLKYLEVDQA